MKYKNQKKIKCNNPELSLDGYAKDNFGGIHFYCENCGEEIVKVGKNKKSKWYHGKLAGSLVMIYDKLNY